jgi:hypothetical protein
MLKNNNNNNNIQAKVTNLDLFGKGKIAPLVPVVFHNYFLLPMV